MITQILTTKLFIPSPSSNLVPRSRLVDKLNEVWKHKFALVSAPAGFGKTTLLSEWINQCDYPTCWLSLDERDNDLKRFLKYVIIALQQVERSLGENALMVLQSSQPLELENLLTGLITEIDAIPHPFIFVLDDYHVITESEIQQTLIFLLNHQPHQMHLIISSRADPPWPLSRLRIQGEVLEIRSNEMRFTLEEAASFLDSFLGLALSSEDIAALEKRTEGWIAGLQMAAISMMERDDIAGFIQSFSGSHRFVMDYLMEEVLNQQPPKVQDFLLNTSILMRLSGSLCDAVIGEKNSQSVLIELEQKNLFLIPLDDQRRWYRYHHLFADLLKNHLHFTRPDDLPGLHIRASVWHRENDLLTDAINHALAANEIEQIAQLTEAMAVYEMDRSDLNALFAWLEHLPDSAFQQYPWLLVTRTWAFFNLGKYGIVEKNLAKTEDILAAGSLEDELAVRIRGHVAAIQSNLAEIRDDGSSAIRQAEKALGLLPEKDLKLRSFVAIRRANCLVWLGHLEQAILAYEEIGETSKLVGDGHLAITALSEMAAIQAHTGRMKTAVESIRDLNHYAQDLVQRDGRQFPALGILYRHMGLMLRELNELTDARSYAEGAVRLFERWGEKENIFFGLLALARIQFAQGEYALVDQNFQQIMKLANQISPQYVANAQNWVFYFQLLRGKSDGTEKWAQDLGLSADDEIGYERIYDYQNFARILFAKGESAQALKVVRKLIRVVDQVGAKLHCLKLKLLAAKILYHQNMLDEAAVELTELLSFFRAQGFVRAILDEGDGVEDLLLFAIVKGIEGEFAGKMLETLGKEPKKEISEMLPTPKTADQLSARELEVLRLLMTELNPIEIADALVVSLNTVRTHIKHIYSKLDVHSRHEAIIRAKELSLL